MALNYTESSILHGAPVAWIQEITVSALTELFHFDFIQEPKYKIPISGTASKGGDNTDIKGADGSLLRFPKGSLIIDAITEEEIVEDATADVDATGFGEITLALNKAPTEIAYKSWTTFVKTLHDKKDSLFLIAIPTGFTYKGRNVSSPKNVDGYFYLICKRSSDIEQTFNDTPTTLSVTFISFRVADSMAGGIDTALTTATWTAINMKIGTSTNIALTPPALVAGDAALLKAGKPVLKTVP
ncbi:MAG: hypothetical protein M1419_00555 [Bacteroidetes bacterium]|nr:hypothetical protein [Bacteroidota bacterium]